MRQRQQHIHLTTSEPNHNPIGRTSSVPGSSAPGFVYSSWDPSVIPSYYPTKYPYPVQIIKQTSVPSENPTKYSSRVPKQLSSAKPGNMFIEYPSGYTTGAPRTMQTGNPSSNTIQANIIPRCSQEDKPWGTRKYAKKSNTIHPSNHLIFILKSKSQSDAPPRESDNIPHRCTWDLCFIFKH